MHLLRCSVDEYRRRWAAFDQTATYLNLSPADRFFAWREQTAESSREGMETTIPQAWRDGWSCWPVPIDSWVMDPYYVGTEVLVRPVIHEFLSDFWDPDSGYQLFVFIGGIGAGKSFSASLSLIYTIYLLSCLHQPQKYLNGFEGVSLSGDAELVIYNASAAGASQASKIVYGEAFDKVQRSPYFSTNFQPYTGKASELLFPNHIRFSPGTSKWQSALGFNLFGFVVDEAAFGIESEAADYVKELFLALNQRRRSRFGRLGFGGLFTSPGSEHSFVEMIAGEGVEWDTSIMVRRTTTWEAKDELKPGARIFLLDRDPDTVRVIDGTQDLIFQGYDGDGLGIAQRPDGSIVRWRPVVHDTELNAEVDRAA
jgi:hypothetical protein